jgi:hypothetical protein
VAIKTASDGITYYDSTGFNIGTADGVSGLTFTGTAGNITLSAGGTVTQDVALTAAGLELLGTGGNYQLTNPANDVTTLAGNTGTINYVNNGSFNIGAVNTVGISVSGGLTLYAAKNSSNPTSDVGDLTVGNAITYQGSSTGTMLLKADDNIIMNSNKGCVSFEFAKGKKLCAEVRK